jgi:hypothetical protein
LDLRQNAQPWRGIGTEDRLQQPHPVLADPQGMLLQGTLALGQAVVEGRTSVTVGPARLGQWRQPFLVGQDELLQRGPQGLGDQLRAIRRPHRGQHMGGVRAHCTAALHQPCGDEVVDHHGQQPIRAVALGHPVPELAEH